MSSTPDIRPIYKNRHEKIRPVQELVPWLDYLTPSIVLNKDGSVMAAFEYSGLDPDNIDDQIIDNATAELERAIVSCFDERVTLWWLTKRRKDRSYLKQGFDNEVSRRVDAAYAASFRAGTFYKMKHWLFVLFTGNTGVESFMDNVSHLVREENKNPVAAFFSAMGGSISASAAFGRDLKQLEINRRGIEQTLTSFVGSTPSLKFRRLEMQQIDNAFHEILNVASDEEVVDRPAEALIDSWMPSNEMVAGEDVIRFTGTGDRYAAIYGIKQWPARSHPMMLEKLMSSDHEMVVSQIVRCMSRTMSEKVLNDAKSYHKMTQFGLLSTVVSKLTKKKPEPNAGKRALRLQCERALARLTAGGPTSAYVNLSVMLVDRKHEMLEERCKNVERIFSTARIGAIRERENLLPSFAAMLPGQWAMQSRYYLMGVDNVADMAPIYTMYPGPSVHPHFSEVAGRAMPPLAAFVDRYGCRYNFVPHVGQVGHAILIAPTESGKTTLVNFMLSQFQKYAVASHVDVNTFVFDRDGSCRITTEIHGGRHVDYKAGRMRCNPFALDDGTPTGRTWIREFIISALRESGFNCDVDHREKIDRTLMMMFDPDNRDARTLSHFAATIADRDIERALGEWLRGRPYGMFDNEDDDFQLEAWTTIEMKELQKIPRLFRMFMDYAFRRIDMKLDGKSLSFIYLEEASYLLGDPGFAKQIKDWLQTFRKKNAFVWLTIQSPDSIDGEVKSALVDNVKTTILMNNKRVAVHRPFYKLNFSLTDSQIDRIMTLIPRRQYMFIQDGVARVVQTVFNAEVLNYLRSEAHLQPVFAKHKATAEADPKWFDNYLAEAATFKRVEYEIEEPEAA